MESTSPAPGAAARPSLLSRIEDGFASLLLVGLILLPGVEVVGRPVGLHLPGAAALSQQLVLLLSLFGAALAGRAGRQIALNGGFPNARTPWRQIWAAWRIGAGTGISAVLAVAGGQYLLSERGGGAMVANLVPVWIVLAAFPLGFGLLTWRAALAPSPGRWTRAAGLALGALIAGLLLGVEAPPAALVTALVVLVVGSGVAGAPIYVLLGGAAAVLFWGQDGPLAVLALDHYRQSTNPTMPALPLFTLAGYLLADGGASRRLVAVMQAVAGRSIAAPALITVVTSAFFTSLTGASGVTLLALGGLLLPVLLRAGYPERSALGLVTGAGSLGLLFAPCLPLILYAIVAEVDLRTMFLAGVGPGLLLCLATLGWAVLGPARRSQRPAAGPVSEPSPRLGPALWEAKWELGVPVVALGGIFSGLTTTVEAAALTAAYAWAIETFAYGGWRKLRAQLDTLRECALLMGSILIILGVALAFTNWMVDAEIPSRLVEFAQDQVQSRTTFLILVALLLLLVGCLMDVYSAIIVVVPLLVPLGAAYGVDPAHLGTLFLANLGLGFLTPPVGINLFLAASRFERTMGEVVRAVVPIFFVQLAAVLVITFWPELSTALPRWFP